MSREMNMATVQPREREMDEMETRVEELTMRRMIAHYDTMLAQLQTDIERLMQRRSALQVEQAGYGRRLREILTEKTP